MKGSPKLVSVIIVSVAMLMAGAAAAMGPGGGMGGGNGMMGGGGHMMGDDAYMNRPGYQQDSPPRTFQRQDERESEMLRTEIRERRQELSNLMRQRPRDEQLIDEKIEELSRLEAEFDRRTQGF